MHTQILSQKYSVFEEILRLFQHYKDQFCVTVFRNSAIQSKMLLMKQNLLFRTRPSETRLPNRKNYHFIFTKMERFRSDSSDHQTEVLTANATHCDIDSLSNIVGVGHWKEIADIVQQNLNCWQTLDSVK